MFYLLCFQLETITLDPIVVLDISFRNADEIKELMAVPPPTRMERPQRLLVCRGYVNYIRTAYKRMFNSIHVHVDVVAAVAKSIVRHFPSMIDIDTGDNPTYVSNFR